VIIKKKKILFFLIVLLCLTTGGVLARMSGRGGGFGGGGRGGGGRGGISISPRTSSGRQQSLPNQQFLNSRESDSLFEWDLDPEFPKDVFTFVRIDYDYTRHSIPSSYYSMQSSRSSYGRGGRGGGGGGGRSSIDWPQSDNNFSYRLHQLTSIEVNPEPVYITLQDPSLFEYPFIYMLEPGAMRLLDQDVKNLREYLLNGGFLMIDDFWGSSQWYNVYAEMKRVFPEREPVLLTLEHPVFHCVFELKALPQIPAYNIALSSAETLSGRTSESGDPPRYYGIYDDKGRMMVIICRDTDLGDGWEREGVSHAYFSEFSEKQAYPLGINIVFYAMTH